jgi:TonB-dependent SusC/RagA subfamily outer membrane receptor
MLRVLVLIFSISILVSCATSGIISGEQGAATSETISDPVDLTDYLNRIAGVRVAGSGYNAVVTIRGPISLNSGTGPLYVVDGNILGHDYAELYSNITVPEIASVNVLKDASDLAFYGSRGAAGVIEVSLKRSIE